MLNQAYIPLTAQVKQFPRVSNDDCIFCHGVGQRVQVVGDEEYTIPCEGCEETGKDDPQLWKIMTGRLKPPVDEVAL